MNRYVLVLAAAAVLVLGLVVFLYAYIFTTDAPVSTTRAASPDGAPAAESSAADLDDSVPLTEGRTQKGRWAKKPGFWFDHDRSGGLTPEQARKMEELSALGYLSGYKLAAGKSGVLRHDEDVAWRGYNLLVSAHAPEALVIDMDGKPVHKWRYDFAKLPYESDNVSRSNTFRRVHLYDNGDLLAIYEYLGLIRLDRRSQKLWYVHNGAHHDLFVADDGRIWVLTSERALLPRYNEEEPIVDEYLTVLDGDGAQLDRISLIESFLRSQYATQVLKFLDKGGDVMHANTVQVFDASTEHEHPAFKPGNVLVCSRNLSVAAVIDPRERRVVWALTGLYDSLHDATLLENGNLLLFDNRGRVAFNPEHGYQRFSRILELDPLTQEIAWKYEGDPPESLSSQFVGTVQRLPNGNTVIVETTDGRVIEVDPEGEIVWEYASPMRTDDGELVAAVFDMVRIEEERLAWLGSP